MKKEVRSFIFKAAQQKGSKSSIKVRDGIAVAGCSMVQWPRGSGNYEPKYSYTRADNGHWC